jgi:hypothetical protein
MLGTNSALYITRFNGIVWGAFELLVKPTLNGQEIDLISKPSCTAVGPGGALCAVLGTDSALYITRFNDTVWNAFERLPAGIFSSAPSCTDYGTGQALCAVLGTDSALYITYLTGAAWSAFERLEGGIFSSEPSSTEIKAGGALCAAVGIDSTLYVSRFDGNTWREFPPASRVNFKNLGQVSTAAPSCVNIANSMFFCAIITTDSVLDSTSFPSDIQ